MPKTINEILNGAIIVYGQNAATYKFTIDRYINIKNELYAIQTIPGYALISIELPEQRKEQIMYELIELWERYK